MKVILASPTYGYKEPTCNHALLNAIMVAANRDRELIWMGAACPDRMGFMDARNSVVESTFDVDPNIADGIAWVDSDIKPELDSLHRLLQTAKVTGHDFISGVYHHRRGEFRPCFYHMDEDGKFRGNIFYEENVLKPEGACGFGFCYTSGRLIQKIKELPHFSKDRGGWFPDHHFGDVSEDMGFCKLAREAGVQLYVDTGIQVAHLGEVEFITRETYIRALAARTEGKIPKEMK